MDNNNEFKIGDVVTLNSGGPKMTITEIIGDDISVTWFNKTKLEIGIFKSALLQSPTKVSSAFLDAFKNM